MPETETVVNIPEARNDVERERPPNTNTLLARIAIAMERQLVNYAAALEVQREGVTLTRDHLDERRKENEAVANREDRDRRLDKSLGAFIKAWDAYSLNGLDDTFGLVEEARRELAEAMRVRGVVL